MSNLRGINFCENPKCGKSIPNGEFCSKGLCSKCWTKKRGRWQIYVVAAILFLAASSIGGLWGLVDRAERDETNMARVETESLDRDDAIVQELEFRTQFLLDAVQDLQAQIDVLGDAAVGQQEALTEVRSHIESINQSLTNNGTEIQKDRVLQNVQLQDLSKEIASIKDQLVSMGQLGTDTITHSILNPTIMVEVREKNNKAPTFGLGTAVIVKKDANVVVAGEVTNRYYAITDAHLFNDIWGYLENTRPQLPPEKQLDPEFWIAHYDGINSKKPDYFVKCEVLFPDNHYVNERVWEHRASAADFAIFTFTCPRDWDVAEVASDAEMAKLKPNDKIFNASVFPTERPGLTTGIVSALNSNMYNGTIVFQCSVNPGSSGSPVFILVDGKPKVAGLIQVISVTQVGGNAVLAYASRMDSVRRYVALSMPSLKDILN